MEGTLTLVDLAGSEHKIDSMYHSAERRKEGAAINASLMALKECIRSRASGNNASHHYRKSKLTMALKSSFMLPSARTVVIVTVSPSSKDTEHSLNSLRHACMMHGQENNESDEQRFVTGGQTTVQQIGEIDITKISKTNKSDIKSGKGMTELKTSNGNVMKNKAKSSFGEGGEIVEDVPLTDAQKEEMRRTSEKKAYAQLTSIERKLLVGSRKLIGQNKLQQRRIASAQELPSVSSVPIDGDEEGIEGVTDNSKATPPKAKKDNRTSISKLKASVYCDETASNDMKYRRFASLLKQHMYSKEEVVDALSDCPRDYVEEMGSRADIVPSNRFDALRSQSTSSARESNTQSSAAVIKTPRSYPADDSAVSDSANALAPQQLSKHEAAKLRRQQMEMETASKRAIKLGSASAAASTNIIPDDAENPHIIAIEALKAELNGPNVSAATTHGIRRRISTHASALLREKRKIEKYLLDNDLISDVSSNASTGNNAERNVSAPAPSAHAGPAGRVVGNQAATGRTLVHSPPRDRVQDRDRDRDGSGVSDARWHKNEADSNVDDDDLTSGKWHTPHVNRDIVKDNSDLSLLKISSQMKNTLHIQEEISPRREMQVSHSAKYRLQKERDEMPYDNPNQSRVQHQQRANSNPNALSSRASVQTESVGYDHMAVGNEYYSAGSRQHPQGVPSKYNMSREDSLDFHLNSNLRPDANNLGVSRVQASGEALPRGRRQHANAAVANSAPFANDYNWNN